MSTTLEIFRVLSSCSSMLMILSPVPVVYKIHRDRSVGVNSIVPLLSTLGNCHIWMLYGYLASNIFPIFATFMAGTIIALGYVSVYYYRAADRQYISRAIAAVIVGLAIATTYALVGAQGHLGQSRAAVAQTIGYVGIIVTFILYTSPLVKVSKVFKHRSGVFIPIHMVVAGVINSALWVTYSSLDGDWFIFAPNVGCLAMGLLQACVYVAFHPRSHPLVGFEPPKPDGEEVVHSEEISIVVSPKTARASDELSFHAIHSPRASVAIVTSA